MNKNRRADLEKAKELLESVREAFEEARDIVNDAHEAEREAFDNLSENLQAGERGQRMDEIANDLSNLSDTLNDIYVDDMIAVLEGAIQE